MWRHCKRREFFDLSPAKEFVMVRGGGPPTSFLSAAKSPSSPASVTGPLKYESRALHAAHQQNHLASHRRRDDVLRGRKSAYGRREWPAHLSASLRRLIRWCRANHLREHRFDGREQQALQSVWRDKRLLLCVRSWQRLSENKCHGAERSSAMGHRMWHCTRIELRSCANLSNDFVVPYGADSN
jgi:hypothetical protein